MRPRKTTSTGPISAGSSVAGGCAWKSPRGLMHRHAALAQRRQLRAARDQRDVGAAARERRADVGADGPGAEHGDLHGSCSASRRRWTLPVGPLGIASSTCTRTGTLKAARRSPQCARSASSADRRARDHDRADRLAVLRVGHREGHGLDDLGVREQRILDLVRRDLLAAAVDQLLDAAGQREVAVRARAAPSRPCGTSRRGSWPPWPRDWRDRSRPRQGRARRPRPRRRRSAAASSSSRIAISVPVGRPTEPPRRSPGGSGFDAIWCAASVMP